MITGNLTKVGAKVLGGEIPGRVYIGIQGPEGKTPELSVGEVETLPPEAPATVDITGTKEKPILNFGIPQGKPGEGSKEPTDLKGYATEKWVNGNFQPKGNYLETVPDDYAKKKDIPKKPEDIGAQPAGNYALKSEIPYVPVQSVNGKTGAVQLGAADVGARPSTWMPSAADVGALPSTYTPPNQTAEQVGADPKGTAATAVSGHNTNTGAHNDIRLLITALTNRLDALANSDDETLDQMAEVVKYIKDNRNLIEQVTTGKVSVTDIINNLTTNVANKPLSAAQGVVIKGLLDALSTDKLDASALTAAINTALAQAKASGEFNGKNGTSATHSWNGTVLTVTSASGTSSADLKGAKGDKGDKGDAYTLTNADKTTIVNAVIAALPVYDGGVV